MAIETQGRITASGVRVLYLTTDHEFGNKEFIVNESKLRYTS